ncbi:neutral zinc metallopeptidase [Catenulispora yoronensis]|uniref:Neutral zinc metallopeptidase n=1 Tax=Catenulispora yoronensis TaxID=450799 RepID=A0ABN2TNS2_9ACTN
MTFDPDAQLDTSDVVDQRGGGGGFPGGRGSVIGLLLALVAAAVGIPVATMGGGSGSGGSSAAPGVVDSSSLAAKCRTGADANANDDCRVVAVVDSVQNYWTSEFANSGKKYERAQTVLFTNSTSTACGPATTQVGPFYCPGDRTVYLDLGFWQELRSKFGAKGGPFAQAYVVAHEYGHHIQDLQGTLGRAQQNAQGPTGGSVRTELQADCYAGIWAHFATTTKDANGRPFIDALSQQDIADALDAASAVGDDRIQQETQGKVSPESWTHGSAAQRQKWFTTGYQTGELKACDTFAGGV